MPLQLAGDSVSGSLGNLVIDNPGIQGVFGDCLFHAIEKNHIQATRTRRNEKTGTDEDVLVADFRVWTDEEATAAGYHPEKGALPTSDEKYKIYRIF